MRPFESRSPCTIERCLFGRHDSRLGLLKSLLVSDWHDRWLTGGLEPDVIAEAHLDVASIKAGVERFVAERDRRLARQREALAAL